MRHIKLLVLFLLFAPLASYATLFEFSYTFNDQPDENHPIGLVTIAGSFEGVEDGLFVRNISNFRANLDGREFSQPLITERYMPETMGEIGNPWNPHVEGLFSFDVNLNNFDVVNADYYPDGNLINYFYMFKDGDRYVRAASNYYEYASDYGDLPNNSWRLAAVQVSEPGSLPLLLLALGVMMMRNRKYGKAHK